ncbi:hypothetical protein SporoP37_07400 [Sporosarcina sp. P37]|nr:hypothetical protein SporoP33_06970 [Sporosarcina sp. P33]ARK24511.1 hypothetical protein SporoP37_07400 [Sporosarcina sp. P37]PID18385.1 hypothetical protein CSV62_09040 [Sporosarcina sp. P35]
MVCRGLNLACGSGMGVPAGDAFPRAWPKPLPSLRSVQGLGLTLILRESPLLPLPSLLLMCSDIDHSLAVMPKLLFSFNLSKFIVQKYKTIRQYVITKHV